MNYEEMPNDFSNVKTDRNSPLAERIERLFDDMIDTSAMIEQMRIEMANAEQNAKVENLTEYNEAKNNDVRQNLVQNWLSNDSVYHEAKAGIGDLQVHYELLRLERGRLELLTKISS